VAVKVIGVAVAPAQPADPANTRQTSAHAALCLGRCIAIPLRCVAAYSSPGSGCQLRSQVKVGGGPAAGARSGAVQIVVAP